LFFKVTKSNSKRLKFTERKFTVTYGKFIGYGKIL